MITVTDDFKTAIAQTGRQLLAKVEVEGDTISYDDDLRRLYIHSGGNLLKTAMRQLKFTYTGTHDVLGKVVEPYLGVVLPSDTTEYINYGEFTVVSIEEDKNRDGIEAVAYDKMHEALVEYDLSPSLSKYSGIAPAYPVTVIELLEAICGALDWTLQTGTTFPNEDFEIISEGFLNQGVTFRYVLDRIAEATGSIILFNTDNELEVRQIGTSVAELNTEKLFSMKVENEFVAENIILAREPQGDYIMVEGILFEDDFNDNDYSADWTLWDTIYDGTAEVNGQLELTTNLAGAYFGILANQSFDLEEVVASLEVIDEGNQSLASYEAYPLVLTDSGELNKLEFNIIGGEISAYQYVEGSSTRLAFDTYDNTAMRYLRIREDGGDIFWETSADNKSWDLFHSVANPLGEAHLQLMVQAGTWDVEAETTQLIVDNVRIAIF